MSAMDSEQFPNSFQLSNNNNNNNGYREYSVADSVPGYFPSAASNHAGASYLVTSVKPNIVQGTNHYSSWIPASYSNRLPSTTSQPSGELGKIEYSQGSSLFMNLDQHYPTNVGAWTMNNTTSGQRDSLSYPLDLNYSYYSTIAGSQSNNNYPQTNNNNMWNRYSSPYMDSSQKESLIWKLERENQNMRKELEEYRKEIDRLRSLMNQGESSRPPPSTSDSASRCQSRYWTPEEHQRFLEAIQIYGHKDVKSIATYVGTRSRTQVRTHAQKYFQRISRNCDSSRIGKRCMSEPNLYGIESQTTCSRFEETSGGEESSSQDELNKQTPSGIDLLSAVASTTCKVPHD